MLVFKNAQKIAIFVEKMVNFDRKNFWTKICGNFSRFRGGRLFLSPIITMLASTLFHILPFPVDEDKLILHVSF
jgi:hypothetical protein